MQDLDVLNYLETFLTEKRKLRFQSILEQRTKHFTVAVEDVYQLHNTSAVIRSCDVFGIQDVHVIEEHNSKRIDKEIAMGAQKWVDLYRYNSTQSCLDNLRRKGYQIVATTPHDNDSLLQDFNVTRPSCFFFGRETEGLSDLVMDQADCFIKIPMVGFTESLNISVSAAIILHDVMSKLKQSNIDWQLTEEEKLDLRFKWCQKTIKSFDEILVHYHSNR